MGVIGEERARQRSFKRGTSLSALAHKYQLGAILRVFAPHPNRMLFWSLLSGICLLAGVRCALLAATTLTEESAQGMVPPLALVCGLPLFIVFCLGLGAWILLGPRTAALSMRVVVCERGLLWCGRRLQIIRWGDMHILWCDASLGHATKVRLSGPDRRAVIIPTFLDEWRTLVRWLERDLTARLFPRILTQYEKTHVACFGPLTLTPDGLVLAHRPALRWQEVSIEERGKMLMVVRVERSSGIRSLWASIPCTQIPNRCVFEALMKHCVRVSLPSPFMPSNQTTRTRLTQGRTTS